MEKFEQSVIGNLTISELITILSLVQEEIGDIPVCAAYDGNWNIEVTIMLLEDRLLIGSIS
jgi:hypothetical protein